MDDVGLFGMLECMVVDPDPEFENVAAVHGVANCVLPKDHIKMHVSSRMQRHYFQTPDPSFQLL